MSDKISEKLSAALVTEKKKAWWRGFLTLAGVAVSLMTVYALILPAVTMANQTFCGYEEHVHSDACNELVLVCGYEETEADEGAGVVTHSHSDACYTTATELTCGLEESEGHMHSADCCTSILTCTDTTEDHEHGEGCYTDELTCGLEESEGHAHSDACCTTISELTCGLEEGAVVETVVVESAEESVETHVHTDACYEKWQVCELEEHGHTLECYADKTADVETASEWEATLPDDEELTGVWADDLLLVAKSQLGYAESTSNYVVLEDGETTKGYTRYGAWYGDAYGDWCAMFVSFCLNYAGVPKEVFPYDASCQNWVETLSDERYDLYSEAKGYKPYPGDLIFFNWDSVADADHVGLVCELIEATDSEPAKVKTIEGNAGDCVCYREYELTDESIMGYSMLPMNPDSVVMLAEETTEDDSLSLIDQYSNLLACGKEEHAHDASCNDAEGNVSCGIEEHAHVQQCLDYSRSCGIAEEHKHSGSSCYYNFHYKCGKVAHSHFYLCDVKPEYCGMELHAHTSDCYDSDSNLVCGAEEHLHILSCWINPEPVGNVIDGEGAYAGASQFHSSHFLKYQASGHTVNSYEIGVFALIPGAESEVDDWIPNTRQWSGGADANYLVAYCSDDRTTSSKLGEDYETYTLDTSRFTNDNQRRKVAAIVGHSYPFLTSTEMKEQLVEAYASGAISVDVSDCTESDWIAATQWAIWDTISTVGTTDAEDIDIDDYGYDRPSEFPEESERYCINPLDDPGITDVETSRIKLKAIHDYLISLQEPIQLAVEDHSFSINENMDGTSKLTVKVVLNRAIVSGENAKFQLQVGDKSTTLTTLPVGENSFNIELDRLAEDDLHDAQVYLSVDGKHMQAYFFDSENYQDLVGGNWEYYEDDLSFELGGGTTTVSVSKVWTEGADDAPASVTVQMTADGEPWGNQVKLSAANSWTHTWSNLLKEDALGSQIEYSVYEIPVEGYYSSLSSYGADGSASALQVTVWEEVDSLEAGGEYVILSETGALTASDRTADKGKYYMNVSPVDLTVVTEDQWASVWHATQGANGCLLSNKLYKDVYIGSDSLVGYSYAVELGYSDNLFYQLSSSGARYYFYGFYSNGYQMYTSDVSKAMSFRLYKLTTRTLPPSDVNYVLTNAKYETEDNLTDVTVTKEWTGRHDGRYPDSVQVKLMQNGLQYGNAVELNVGNGWTFTWEDLPIEVDGAEIEYSVIESEVKGYEVAIGPDSSGYSFELTNTWQPAITAVELEKIDYDDPSRLLDGAVFNLYIVDSEADASASIPGTDGLAGVLDQVIEVGGDGSVSIELEVGETYYLEETRAPDGYNTMVGTLGFEVVEQEDGSVSLAVFQNQGYANVVVDSGALKLQIKNAGGYELPETGGAGRAPYAVGGVLLLITGAIALSFRAFRAGSRAGGFSSQG